jgi:hypothetical protein
MQLKRLIRLAVSDLVGLSDWSLAIQLIDPTGRQ